MKYSIDVIGDHIYVNGDPVALIIVPTGTNRDRLLDVLGVADHHLNAEADRAAAQWTRKGNK
jgi:hypothetical protein